MPYPATDTQDETDFRSRYPVETAGMPANLAAVASRNLAVQDAATQRVNAVARLNPSPGVGAVGSTPETDATNLAVAAAMDRGDLMDRSQPDVNGQTPTLSAAHTDDIMARRAQIASQKQDLMTTLGATRMDDSKNRAQILQTWHALDAEDKNLLQEHQYNAIDAAKTAHENLVRQLHIQSSNGLAKIINGIAGIDAPIGTDEHTAAALKILGNTTDPEIAAARGTPGFDKILGPYADQAKKSALTSERIKQAADSFRTATGLEPASVETTATGGVNIRGSAEGGNNAADKELSNAYGIRQTNLLNPQSVRIVGQPKSTDPGDVNGNFIEVKTLSKGQPTTVYMPRSDYLRFGGKLAEPSQPASAAASTQSPVTEVTRVTKDGRQAVFDANSKKFLRYAQ
jgi:hypothetical protein